jgi:pyruvate/2-oxoacid:ferredoxin oxidoreductase alpha subunit
MGSVNNLNPKIDNTVRVFDSFNSFEQQVDANEYDAVNSYFTSVFRDKQAALNFTTTLFRIAAETSTPVLTLLSELSGQNNVELTASLAYYLNGLRSPATLLGINSTVTPNFYTARNVLP